VILTSTERADASSGARRDEDEYPGRYNRRCDPGPRISAGWRYPSPKLRRVARAVARTSPPLRSRSPKKRRPRGRGIGIEYRRGSQSRTWYRVACTASGFATTVRRCAGPPVAACRCDPRAPTHPAERGTGTRRCSGTRPMDRITMRCHGCTQTRERSQSGDPAVVKIMVASTSAGARNNRGRRNTGRGGPAGLSVRRLPRRVRRRQRSAAAAAGGGTAPCSSGSGRNRQTIHAVASRNAAPSVVLVRKPAWA
jgi:hypothetical protein